MKQLTLLLFTVLAVFYGKQTAAQAVLNEIYSDPGASNHEFFELYNTSISGAPVSMDNYTIVTYFENGNTEKGFYVLDLPNLSVGPKGYFVGASQMPFNYQGTTGSTAADFSWNDPQLADKYGYLKKYVLSGGANVPDNQKTCTQTPAPSNLNDLFHKRSGNGASYATFVYQNGQLVNAFFGGTGGNNTAPSYITTLPPLTIDILTENNTTPFIINFASLSNRPVEGVTENTGSDNGFIRTRDGLCNAWGKSSANVYHTPGTSNGGAAGIAGALTPSSHIYMGASPADSASLTYNITSGPIALFPVNLQVYLDNGVIEGQLDSADVFVGQNTETVVTDGPFSTRYMPQYQDLLLVAETSIGCLDQIRHILPPESAAFTTLPVNITRFKATPAADHNLVEWSVEGNHEIQNFEVQKSYDGIAYTTISRVNATDKNGTAHYTSQVPKEAAKIFYRLKMRHNNEMVSYSKATIVNPATQTENTQITLQQNPVRSRLVLQYTSNIDEEVTLAVYTISGVKVFGEKAKTSKGVNTYSIPADSLSAGTYALQIIGRHHSKTAEFIKQ